MSEVLGTKVRCPGCGAKVRIPPTLSLSDARCPKCGTALDGKSAPNELPKQIGPYRIVRRIAAGGMGVVYEAKDSQNNAVAVKTLSDEAAGDPELVKRFEREAHLGMHLHHPHLVGISEIDKDGKTWYMVMELVTGTSLSRALSKEGPMPMQRALSIMRPVVEAVRHMADQQVVHRDIKPHNILLTDDDLAKLADFGLSKAFGGPLADDGNEQFVLTLAGDQLGTPAYMAPEQVEDSSTVTPATDIYGLCATLFHLVTGRAPYQGKGAVALMEKVLKEPTPSAAEVEPSVPPALDALLAWGMEKDLSLRIPDAAALLAAMDQALAAPNDAAEIEGRHFPKRQKRSDRKKRSSAGHAATRSGNDSHAALLIIILLVCLAGAGAAWYFSGQEHPRPARRTLTIIRYQPRQTEVIQIQLVEHDIF